MTTTRAAKTAPAKKTAATTPARTVTRKKAASTPPMPIVPTDLLRRPRTTVTIPDDSVAKAYITRTLPGGKSDHDTFDYAFDTATNILIEGPTGPGKTMSVRAWAAKNKKLFARVPCNVGIEPSKLFGKFLPNADGSFHWHDGSVTQIVREGGVILINEGNMMPDRIASVLFALLDDNREIILDDKDGEVVRAHRPNCWCDLPTDECKSRWVLVVMDMNPNYAGTRELNAAFRDRFTIQLVFDYDPVIEAKLVKCAALRKLAKQMRDDAIKGTYETPVSTRMLQDFERVVDGMGFDFAVSNFVNHFSVDERPAVAMVLQTYEANLRAHFDPKPTSAATATTDDTVKVHPDWTDADGKVWKHGDVDPEWGTYGVDWEADPEWVFAESE